MAFMIAERPPETSTDMAIWAIDVVMTGASGVGCVASTVFYATVSPVSDVNFLAFAKRPTVFAYCRFCNDCSIAAIVVAGGAGLTMWNAVLMPGTYPRTTALRRGAVRGLKLIVGLVPVFVAAAVLEGYVTRLTDMPLAASALVIGGSAAFLLFYFVVLPYRRARA